MEYGILSIEMKLSIQYFACTQMLPEFFHTPCQEVLSKQFYLPFCQNSVSQFHKQKIQSQAMAVLGHTRSFSSKLNCWQ